MYFYIPYNNCIIPVFILLGRQGILVYFCDSSGFNQILTYETAFM